MRLLYSLGYSVLFVTARLCSFAKLCTVSPVDEHLRTWLATCNEPLYHLHPVVCCCFFEVLPRLLVNQVCDKKQQQTTPTANDR